MNILRQILLIFECDGGRKHGGKRGPQFVTERGKKPILREIRTRFFLQLLVRFLELLLAALELSRERLRLLKQIFRPRVRLNSIEDNADALGQLIEKRLMC